MTSVVVTWLVSAKSYRAFSCTVSFGHLRVRCASAVSFVVSFALVITEVENANRPCQGPKKSRSLCVSARGESNDQRRNEAFSASSALSRASSAFARAMASAASGVPRMTLASASGTRSNPKRSDTNTHESTDRSTRWPRTRSPSL